MIFMPLLDAKLNGHSSNMIHKLIAKAVSTAKPDRHRKRLGEAVAPQNTIGESCGPDLHRARLAVRWAVSRAFREGS